MNTYLSVIIPAYNEGERIIKTLKRISYYLQKHLQNRSCEILVVNDGSRDNTAEIVLNLKSQIPNLNLIDRKENKGKGYSVKEGMLAVKGAIRLFTDADNSTDISYFEKMIPLFESGYDIVISTRDPKDVAGASQDVPQPWHKRLMGNLGNLYIQIMAVPGIWDTQNGFKAFTAGAAEKIFSLTKIERWAFDVEVLALARKFKYKIGIIPIHWINDPKSHVKLSNYFKVLLDVFKIRWNLILGKYGK